VADSPDTGASRRHSPDRERAGRYYALEICFLAFIAVVTLVFLWQATGYKLVSSRTPFVIMVPLLALIVVHARRLWRIRADFRPQARIRAALSGATPEVNSVFRISLWMTLLVFMIWVLGHVVGIAVFCIILMRFLAKESWPLTLIVTILTAAFIYGVFEYAFNIDLYRGLILRYFLGFRDF